MRSKDDIIAKAAGAFDKVHAMLAQDNRMFLLKRSGETSALSIVAEIETGFWSRWSEYREATVFMWASSAAEWEDRVAQTGQIGYGVPDADSLIDVFDISPDARDRIAPTGANLFWKLYGTRVPSVRFEVPA